jgi:hypothetical protein
MEQKKKRTGNRIPLAAAGLLCLALLSSWLISGLLARYTTSAEDQDAALVAKFDITGASKSATASIVVKPGSGTEESSRNYFTVKVKNNSEVAVKYLFSMEVEGNLPLTVKAKSDTGLQQDSSDTTNLSWYATDVANADADKEYQFYPVWDSADDSYRYSEGVAGIRITVTAEQED